MAALDESAVSAPILKTLISLTNNCVHSEMVKHRHSLVCMECGEILNDNLFNYQQTYTERVSLNRVPKATNPMLRRAVYYDKRWHTSIDTSYRRALNETKAVLAALELEYLYCDVDAMLVKLVQNRIRYWGRLWEYVPPLVIRAASERGVYVSVQDVLGVANMGFKVYWSSLKRALSVLSPCRVPIKPTLALIQNMGERAHLGAEVVNRAMRLYNANRTYFVGRQSVMAGLALFVSYYAKPPKDMYNAGRLALMLGLKRVSVYIFLRKVLPLFGIEPKGMTRVYRLKAFGERVAGRWHVG